MPIISNFPGAASEKVLVTTGYGYEIPEIAVENPAPGQIYIQIVE